MTKTTIKITKSAADYITEARCNPERISVQRMCRYCTNQRAQKRILTHPQLFRECYFVTNFCEHKCQSHLLRNAFKTPPPCPDILDIEEPTSIHVNSTWGLLTRNALGDQLCIEEHILDSTETTNSTEDVEVFWNHANNCTLDIKMINQTENDEIEYDIEYNPECRPTINKTIMEEQTREEVDVVQDCQSVRIMMLAFFSLFLISGIVIFIRKMKKIKLKKEEKRLNSK